MAQLEPLLRRNFLEYASYVVLERALPDLRDGLKPVQRRILHTLFKMHDGRLHKVANVIGETMKLHPHGDAPIGDALVALANKGLLIERQGNFGNVLTGHPAAAPRYIECRLTPLALETLFDESLTSFAPSYDGRTREPVVLPCKLPLVLMLGAEGIAVGMNTRILPHNPRELLEAQIALLRGQAFRLLPDFQQGGAMDAAAYDDGRGSVRVRARMEEREDGAVVIREIPYSTTTESVIASIEEAARAGRIKIDGIDDYTTADVEIVVRPAPGVPADTLRDQLYACTLCQQTLSSSLVAIVDGRPQELSVTAALCYLTDHLLMRIRAELEHEIDTLVAAHHWLTLERIFIEERIYRRIEEAETDAAVRAEVEAGLAPFAPDFVRPLEPRDVEHLLGLHVRRISLYDLESSHRDEEKLLRALETARARLADLTGTAVRWLKDTLKRRGGDWVRRTRIESFEALEKAAVAHKGIVMSYDPETGFFGTRMRTQHHRVELSAYDRVLAVCEGGRYVVTGPADRVLLRGRVLHLGLLPAGTDAAFTIVYRDPLGIVYAKRTRIAKSTRAADAQILPEELVEVAYSSLEERPGSVHLQFEDKPWLTIKEGFYSLNDLPYHHAADKGARLAPWPVRAMTFPPGAAPS